ncbi:hypothetical protein XNC1_2900 [Xenorhabdus nematophila ATCC 19061]|uniref:Uncharacterized protein n=2 Tax=Xenorhabdus nematophila TaxID=628 RepID=D3VJ97_XENNA|nr:hypothetical protein XNC1_2900 [Xenorhabdus nematophila ATCC 19061]
MVGLNSRVPVKPVQAAQSPLNIMCGNYTPLTACPRGSSKATTCGSQRIINIMSGTPADWPRRVWRTRLRLLLPSSQPVLGKNHILL